MLKTIQEGDAVFSRAITIAAPEERDAFIAQACGNDMVLRRQVQERVAAHFQAGDAAEKPVADPASGATPSRAGPSQASLPHAHHHHEESAAEHPQEGEKRKYPRLLTSLTVLMVAATAAGVGLTIWAIRTQKEAHRVIQENAEACEQARQAEEQFKHQREQVEAEQLTSIQQRDAAISDEKAARDAVEDMKAALAFFQSRVLSAGRPIGWTGGLGKEVTLRKAVDVAASRVGEAFPDRPLAEAAIREILGSTYLDLTDPARAVKEYERALALREAVQGEQHPDTAACRNQLAVAYRLADRPMEASRLYEPDNQSFIHASALAIRAAMLLAEKKPVEAEEKLRECLAIRQKIQRDDWSTYETKAMLGQALMQQKQFAEAEPLLRSGCEGMKQQQDKIPPQGKPHYIKALQSLVQLYDAEKRKDKADPWRKELKKMEEAAKP